jgi:hypothetical protein
MFSCFSKAAFKGTVPLNFETINKSHVEGRSKFILHGEGGTGRSEKGVVMKQQQKIRKRPLSGVHSIMMEKLAQTGVGTISNITCKVVVYAPAERADHRVHIEWQWPLSGVHSIMMEKSAQPGEGGAH